MPPGCAKHGFGRKKQLFFLKKPAIDTPKS